MRAPTLLLLVVLLSPAAAARGQVWTVDDDGGADYTDIQAAVDAAADGDVILVASGLYAPFGVSAKGVSVVADGEQTALLTGQVTIADLPACGTVVLRRLSTSAPSGHGLDVRDCAGSVLVEECAFRGRGTPAEYEPEMDFFGARVRGSANVVLARSTLTGGDGGNVGFFAEPWYGAHGIQASGSTVTVVDCDLRGGDGADAPFDDVWDGAAGGHGVLLHDATLWIFGSRASGGDGGTGDYHEEVFPFPVEVCGAGGDGGSGIRISTLDPVDFDDPAASTVTVRDFAAEVGLGGGAVCGPFGDDGQRVLADGSAPHVVSELPGEARGLHVNSPVRGGTSLRVRAEGVPGDAFLVSFGAAPLAPLDLGLVHPLAVAPPYTTLVLGVVPAAGALQKLFPLSPFGPGFGGTTVPAQGVLWNVETAAVELAPAGTVTLLEEVF